MCVSVCAQLFAPELKLAMASSSLLLLPSSLMRIASKAANCASLSPSPQPLTPSYNSVIDNPEWDVSPCSLYIYIYYLVVYACWAAEASTGGLSNYFIFYFLAKLLSYYRPEKVSCARRVGAVFFPATSSFRASSLSLSRRWRRRRQQRRAKSNKRDAS